MMAANTANISHPGSRPARGMRTIGCAALVCALAAAIAGGPTAASGADPAAKGPDAKQIDHLQGEMAGEVATDSVILQSRLTAPRRSSDGDVEGAAGVARFEISEHEDFSNSTHTEWLTAGPEHDFVVKAKVAGLKPATRYVYRLQFGPDRQNVRNGPAGSFRTHHPPGTIARHAFVVVTGMNYGAFHDGKGSQPAYTGPDKALGYPALASILKKEPDFFIGTGDNVYYDSPKEGAATTAAAMRKKWHQQFVQPRYVDLFARVPTYWEKDDHDFRYDDCDNTTDREPGVKLGLAIFREQVPITDPRDPQAVTFRTVRPGKLVQIWLTENRDYRSPNRSPDGPAKSIWGAEQREWLQRTLAESDATFKVLVSPTPLVGPDDLRKKDNHCDIGGFQHERDAFFDWAVETGLLGKGFYIICGDRHWQYHSIDPRGVEEFSTGALVDANSRLGVKPGAANGTDPNGTVRQPYTSREPSGGFLHVVVEPDGEGRTATARFEFFDEKGVLLHSVDKTREIAPAGATR